MNAAHVTRSGTTDDMHRALSQRAPIEQAKGMLMAMHRISADAAFALLVDRSQGTNRKLRDIAQELVDRVSGER